MAARRHGPRGGIEARRGRMGREATAADEEVRKGRWAEKPLPMDNGCWHDKRVTRSSAPSRNMFAGMKFDF